MAIKYLYIDDSVDEREGIARGLSIKLNELIIEISNQLDWENTIDEIEKRSSKSEIDGVLLDWQLQSKRYSKNGGQEQTNEITYSSEGLAQHIRNLATNRKIVDIPIVLCSAVEHFEKEYSKDMTSHDLFDVVYDRRILIDEAEKKTIKEFISLSNGYKRINTSKNIESILGLATEKVGVLDVEFREQVQKQIEKPAAHEIARFLLHEVIEYQGILIDEDVLAARLGVDIHYDGKNPEEKEALKKAWEELKEKLKLCKYTGVFGDAWERWWWFEIDAFWNHIAPKANLQTTSGKDRVDVLKSALKLEKLNPAPKLKYANSDEFWTVCIISKKPIDIYDGFVVDRKTNYSWQEKNYISNEMLLLGEHDVKVDIWEKKRLKEFKQYIKSIA